MTALATELAKHVDPSGTQHHLVLLAPDKLRCLICTRTLDLRPALAAVPGSTSTSRGLPRAEQACTRHPGEWPDTCGRCRSEQLERQGEPEPPRPTADVTAGAARVRAALPRAEEVTA